MENWQKDRNYRKHKADDGSIACVITIDGTDVAVSEEVFEAYSKADRRERYCDERDAGRLLSLEQFDEDHVLLDALAERHVESAEDTAIRKMLVRSAVAAIDLLETEEQELIRALYFEGVPIREFARRKGLSDFAIRHREGKVLSRLKKFLEN